MLGNQLLLTASTQDALGVITVVCNPNQEVLLLSATGLWTQDAMQAVSNQGKTATGVVHSFMRDTIRLQRES